MPRDDGTPEYRCWLFNQFQQAVAHEVVPAIHADSGGPQAVIVAGASIGAFNSLALICRYPHLFRAAVCMSGTYDVERFIGGFTEDLYFSSPLHFLPGLEGPALDVLRQRFVVWPPAPASGRTSASRGARPTCWARRASPTGSTTGARTTTTTGRPGGRCCRRTSNRPCPT